MASQSAPPAEGEQPAAAKAPASPAPAAPCGPAVRQYVGEPGRTYRFPGKPVTVEHGDVVEIPYDPGDGNWQPTTAKATRLPDNDPSNQPKPPHPEDVAHSLAERDAILGRLGVDAPKEA